MSAAMERQFPILDSSARLLPSLPRTVPWAFVAPHEPQALRNHDQTLERLAQRGGLAWTELADVVQGRPGTFRTLSKARHVAAEALAAVAVLELVEAWEKARRRPKEAPGV